MKSKIFDASGAVRRARRFFDVIYRDKITVFAAQAAFCICISVLPFLMLLFSLAGTVAPGLWERAVTALSELLPDGAVGIFNAVIGEAVSGGTPPLLSTAAIGALYSASKGIRGMIRGVSEVYGAKGRGTFFSNVVTSLFATLFFMAVIILTVAAAIVASPLLGAVTGLDIGDVMIRSKSIVLFFFLSAFFSLFYFLSARGIFFIPKMRKEAKCAPKRFKDQIPGAAIASAGWLLFSFFYSLYITRISHASYLYGSLGAAVFLMLWLYFCILILLFGAEVNKYLAHLSEINGDDTETKGTKVKGTEAKRTAAKMTEARGTAEKGGKEKSKKGSRDTAGDKKKSFGRQKR